MSLIVQGMAALLAVAHLIAAFIASGHALLTKHDPRSAWGWIAVCLLFPLAGSLLYYLFGVNRVRRRARVLIRADTPIGPGRHPQDAIPAALEALALTADALTGRPALGGNVIQALHDGEEAYPAMLEAIHKAEHSVWLSTYLFRRDQAGRAFADALTEAHQRGVQVRVLIDGFGVLYGLGLMHWVLRRRGVPVALFFPPRLLPPMLYMNLRNHRKIMVVDGVQAFVGGMNIGDHHQIGHPRGGVVSDLHFCLRGPIVAQLAAVFVSDWRVTTRKALARPPMPEPLPDGVICRVITDGPDKDIDKLFLILLNAMAVARTSIRIMTPYFIPSGEVAVALRTAALRGVQVELVLPARSNLRFVDYACRHHLADLIEAGVKVYLQPDPFAHHKLFIVDDCYAQIGSANMDPRSLRLNFEIAVEIYDEGVAGQLAQEISRRREQSRLLALTELRQRRLLTKLRDAFFWLFSPYL